MESTGVPQHNMISSTLQGMQITRRGAANGACMHAAEEGRGRMSHDDAFGLMIMCVLDLGDAFTHEQICAHHLLLEFVNVFLLI